MRELWIQYVNAASDEKQPRSHQNISLYLPFSISISLGGGRTVIEKEQNELLEGDDHPNPGSRNAKLFHDHSHKWKHRSSSFEIGFDYLSCGRSGAKDEQSRISWTGGLARKWQSLTEEEMANRDRRRVGFPELTPIAVTD